MAKKKAGKGSAKQEAKEIKKKKQEEKASKAAKKKSGKVSVGYFSCVVAVMRRCERCARAGRVSACQCPGRQVAVPQ